MSKLAIAGIGGVVVVAAAAAAPWYVGQKAETGYQDMITQANAEGVVQLTTDSYTRGYGSSQVITRVTFADPSIGVEDALVLVTDISHGILGVDTITRPQIEDPALLEFFGNDPAGWPTLNAHVGLSGAVDGAFVVPEIKKAMEDGAQIDLSRLELNFAVSGKADHVSVDFDWPGATIAEGESVVRFGQFSGKSQAKRLTDNVWIGDSKATLVSISGNPPGEAPFSLENLSITADTREVSGGRVDSEFDMQLGRLQVADMDGQNHRFRFSLTGASVAELDKLMGTLDEVSRMQSEMTDPQAAMMRQFELFGRMAGEARALAQKGMSLALPELRVNTPQGALEGSFVMRHPEIAGEAPESVLQSLTGDLVLSVPRALIEALGEEQMMQMEGLVEQGFVNRTDSHYRVEASLAEMMVNLNGQSIPVPPLF